MQTKELQEKKEVMKELEEKKRLTEDRKTASHNDLWSRRNVSSESITKVQDDTTWMFCMMFVNC